MIPRLQKQSFADQLKENKIILVTGPAKVGKEELIQQVISESQLSSDWINCQDKSERKKLEAEGVNAFTQSSVIVLEEAQYLSNLQTIVEASLSENVKSRLIISCSFMPRLEEELLEALRMSGLEIQIFAPSFYESAQHFGLPQEEQLLEERLIFGNYPQVLNDLENAQETLSQLIRECIQTNLGAHDRINKEDKMLNVLRQLAFHIGDAVSFNEVAENTGLDNETVERYVDLLEEAFLLIKLPSYHTNQRYELKKSHVIYFVDNGIRNALINNFNPTNMRNDMDQLWKNYLVSERLKWIRMHQMKKHVFFWKTHTKQQMDWIEEDEHGMRAYKTDWVKRKKIKFPKSFNDYYPTAKVGALNRSTYWNFLTKKN